MSDSDGVHTKSLEEWIQDDGWKDSGYYDDGDWDRVDYYVSEGLMTSRDRDLLHAYVSMQTEGAAADQFDATDSAKDKFNSVDDQHQADYDKLDDLEAKDLHGPMSDGPAEGVDYFDTLPPTENSDKGVDDVGSVPKVPDYGKGSGGDGKVAVNREAITTFAKNMESLRTMLETSKNYVGQIDVKSGCFSAAYSLNENVNAAGGDKGASGLKGTTVKFISDAMMTLYDMQTELKKVVDMYENGEELNKASSDKLNQLMAESYSDIDNLKSAGQEA